MPSWIENGVGYLTALKVGVGDNYVQISKDGVQSFHGTAAIDDSSEQPESFNNIILTGRLATGTLAGTANDIDATTDQYGEGLELRYNISDWADTYTITAGKGMYLRMETNEANAAGSIYGAEIYGVTNNVDLGNLWGGLCYAYVKGVAAKTLTGVYAFQPEISFDAGSAANTITDAAIVRAKLTGGVMSDYTVLDGYRLTLGDMDGQSRTYGNGILLEDDAATAGTNSLTVGLNIAIGCTTGISLAFTGNTASSKALSTAGFTLNDANLGDGYGAVEVDLTLTGTDAGHVAAFSSWVNMNTGTHGAGGNFIAAQNNGIYEDAAAVITGANVIFGMRAQCICGDNDAAGYFPFSINTSGVTTTALFQCNTPALDLGLVVNAGSDAGNLIPIAKDVGGTVHYVKTYTLV